MIPARFFPWLVEPSDRTVLRFGDHSLTVTELGAAVRTLAAHVRDAVAPGDRIAFVADERLETAVAVAAALVAGRCATPCNPRGGELELAHQVASCEPVLVLGDDVPPALADLPRLSVDVAALLDDAARGAPAADDEALDPELPALVMYTSGTTGLPKGAVLPRRALMWDIDALAAAWAWTPADRLVHALPLYHVHGLVLGVLGPMRVGSALHHVGRFDPANIGAALADGGTMLFGVPTMYQRMVDAAPGDDALTHGLRQARLLVSGSAGLPLTVHEEVRRLSGSTIVERYGMTETCITCAVPAAAPRPGTVGPPLPGIDLRLVDDDGADLAADDHTSMGEVLVRGPSLFLGYLGDEVATGEIMADGWLRSGDLATRDEAGYLRIVGRRSVDLIECGGYKIGAGEIESALLAHPDVAEAAVKGLPDPDLGEQVACWLVPRPGADLDGTEVAEHVARLLSAHKRPRSVFVVESLPRNAMGKVTKRALVPPADHA